MKALYLSPEPIFKNITKKGLANINQYCYNNNKDIASITKTVLE